MLADISIAGQNEKNNSTHDLWRETNITLTGKIDFVPSLLMRLFLFL
jgi:hypothetical protein